MEPPEITFIVPYRCPRCQAELEARSRELSTWLRCPKCGRASLPPEHTATPPPRQPLGDDVLVIGPATRGPGPRAHAEGHPGGVQRIVLAVGLLISLTMLAISFVEQAINNVMIFGFATIVLFALIGFSARRR